MYEMYGWVYYAEDPKTKDPHKITWKRLQTVRYGLKQILDTWVVKETKRFSIMNNGLLFYKKKKNKNKNTSHVEIEDPLQNH